MYWLLGRENWRSQRLPLAMVWQMGQVGQREIQRQRNRQRSSHPSLWPLRPCLCPFGLSGFWFSAWRQSVAVEQAILDPSPISSNLDPKFPTNPCRQRIDRPAPSSARCDAWCHNSNEYGNLGTLCAPSCSIDGMCRSAMDMLRPCSSWRCKSSVKKRNLWNDDG